MNKVLLLLSTALLTYSLSAQSDCYKTLEDAFTKRGAHTVSDEMHPNVIISYFEKNGTHCVSGKVRVENGQITAIFIQFDDLSYELLEIKFYNDKKAPPRILNGISEMISTADGQKLKIVFIDKLKPKTKVVKAVVLPDDL